jgi:hypothetical protein
MADVPTSEMDTNYTSQRGAMKLCMSQDLKSINHILIGPFFEEPSWKLKFLFYHMETTHEALQLDKWSSLQ